MDSMTLLIIGIVAVVAIVAIVAVVANRKKQSGAAVPPPATESQQAEGVKPVEAKPAETEEQPAETGKPSEPEAETEPESEPAVETERKPEEEPAAEPETEAEEEPAAEPEPTEPEEKPAPAPKAEVVKPEPAASRLTRLKSRLANSANPFGKALFSILTKDNLSESDWEDVEDTLLLADVGADASEQLVEELRKDARVNDEKTPEAVRGMLRDRLLDLVGRDMDRSLNASRPRPADAGPSVIMMVGVNGTGKTTTAGKLARLFVAEDKKVVMGAADTFRAAAADQLETWGRRVNVPVVRSEKDGADPASVAFEAAKAAKEQNADVLIIDTAGRLQNKANLMDELGKIRRVTEKTLPVEEVLLVLDATTGQNGMAQAKVFAEAIGITGIVLTKLDGSAKGGIVISVQKELGVPVKLIGLGEGPDDLAPFDPEGFVDGILG
ncbi:signal recognition particle-docking protein FtsY [Bifidobacterium sp. SMB2]|uniref:Signal recognition particle receptor FtsY n=1 Tax=Bifidobacterium saimiriisciurei TaxID=2661627 RepID=A0ABX0CH35_9BIFI|nr:MULTISPECIES: signal recognition particle-docking protein FtsY [Bifidobacterium]NEG97050.1 signal recognition particle-docking protein FtsY [Bifidobacterium sp. SMB2]NEH12174.1 signal recognition particle-docking protein FtsY [Bifidobacterium saimiriisciurei]